MESDGDGVSYTVVMRPRHLPSGERDLVGVGLRRAGAEAPGAGELTGQSGESSRVGGDRFRILT